MLKQQEPFDNNIYDELPILPRVYTGWFKYMLNVFRSILFNVNIFLKT